MSKTLNFASKSATLMTALLVGLSSAAANSPRNNAAQVENVTLSQPGINMHVTLNNTAVNKHVDNMQIEPDNTVMHLPLNGYVKCVRDSKTTFGSARAYFGTVMRHNQDIQPINSLYDASYAPSFSQWAGVVKGWITESGNVGSFQVPLNKVKNGHPAVRFDPVELLNAKLQEHINKGGSKLEFFKRDQYITVDRPVSLAGTCRETANFSGATFGSGFVTVTVPLTITYKGDAKLFDAIGSESSTGKFAVPFQVTSAKVIPHIKDYVGQCPADLKFNLPVYAQGTGTVKYRLISETGAKGSVNNLEFNKSHNGVRVLDFTRAIQDANQGGINSPKFAAQQPKQGNVNQFAANPTDKNTGSWRVELVEPKSSISEESFYSWKCEKGNLPKQIKALGTGPVDPKPVVPNGLKIRAN